MAAKRKKTTKTVNLEALVLEKLNAPTVSKKIERAVEETLRDTLTDSILYNLVEEFVKVSIKSIIKENKTEFENMVKTEVVRSISGLKVNYVDVEWE